MKLVPLGDLVEKVGTWNPTKSQSDEFVYVDLSSVDNEAKAITKPTRTVGSEAPSRARQLLCTGDVLVSTVRPNLNAVAIVPTEIDGSTGSTGFTVLRPTDRLDRQFLFHWVRSPAFVKDMVRKATGASYPAVSDKIVKGSMVPLPPVDEQRRIATILDQADAIRTKRRQILTHLDTLTQSIFHDVFDALSRTVELGDSLTFVTSGGRGWAKYYSETGDRFIRSLDVRMGSIADRDPVYVHAPDNAEARRTKTRTGDVLLTITGSRIGRAAALPDSVAGAYVSQHVAILRPDPDRLRSVFLAAMLGLPHLGQRLIAAAQYGQTKPGLNFEQIRAFALPRPDLNAQDKLAERVGHISSQRAVIQRAVAADDELLASLQSRAFRGEL